MTPAQKDMAELGLDEQALAAKQEHISQLLNGSDTLGEQLKASIALVESQGPYDNLERCENCDELKLDVRASRDGDVLLCDDCAQALAPKKRKKRSDAGEPKQKSPAIAQQPGFLSAEQASRLTDLINTQESRRAEYDAAQDHVEFLAGRLDAARHELCDYLLELQGKKTG